MLHVHKCVNGKTCWEINLLLTPLLQNALNLKHSSSDLIKVLSVNNVNSAL